MISSARSIGVCVSDQDQAIRFFVDRLGFEVRRDEPMGPEVRWIELAPPGGQTVIVPYTPEGLEDRVGSFTGVVFECGDIGATHDQLRERGVKFTQAPVKQDWGTFAQFVDLDGNSYGLIEAAAA